MEPNRALSGRHSDQDTPSRPPSTFSLSSWSENIIKLFKPSSDDSDNDIGDNQTGSNKNEAPEPLSRHYRRQGKRTRRLQAIVNTLKEEGWSFAQFLSAWVKADNIREKGIMIKHRQYGRVGQRRQVLLDTVTRDPQLSNILYMQTESYTAELDCLIQEPYFATFDKTSKIKDLDFDVAFRSMQDTAPGWHAALMRLLGNQRARHELYASDSKYPTSSTSFSILTHTSPFSTL